MRTIEIRRHSLRNPPDPHLSPEGRILAEEVGRARGPFSVAVTSPSLRAVETASAMGCPPTRTESVWQDLGPLADHWPTSFADSHRLWEQSGAVREFARPLARALSHLRSELAEGSAALVVTHGGFPELAATLAGADPSVRPLGPACRCLEGVLLTFHGEALAQATDLRVPAERTRL